MTNRVRASRSIWVIILALGVLSSAGPAPAAGQSNAGLAAEIDRRAREVREQVVAWRRDIHEHPELANRETRTARLVAEHLRSLGMEVETEVAHTGVVGVLRGGEPGPVVALRADMDALPVTEQVDVPFASEKRTMYNGREVGVMHACGHDAHVAILMGVAEVLAGMRQELPGTVKFIFQPAEEGPPPGEDGGASMMIRQGVLQDPRPDAIFALHVWPIPVGTIQYRPRGTMASADELRIVVHGRQTHGAMPWRGIDPIVVGARIVSALQMIPSRQMNVTVAPSVVTIGSIHGGVRGNIIPDSLVMEGTIRALDPAMRKELKEHIRRTAEKIAESAGATAEVTITPYAPVVYNDPALTKRMSATLKRVVGKDAVSISPPRMVAEDFAHYQQEIPGMYFFLGIVPEGTDPADAPPNHSPYFFIDEDALPVGVRVMAHLAVDYLVGHTE